MGVGRGLYYGLVIMPQEPNLDQADSYKDSHIHSATSGRSKAEILLPERTGHISGFGGSE